MRILIVVQCMTSTGCTTSTTRTTPCTRSTTSSGWNTMDRHMDTSPQTPLPSSTTAPASTPAAPPSTMSSRNLSAGKETTYSSIILVRRTRPQINISQAISILLRRLAVSLFAHFLIFQHKNIAVLRWGEIYSLFVSVSFCFFLHLGMFVCSCWVTLIFLFCCACIVVVIVEGEFYSSCEVFVSSAMWVRELWCPVFI